MSGRGRARLIESLRAKIGVLEGGGAVSPLAGKGAPAAFSLCAEALDAALPWGGLPLGAVHEVGAEAYADGPAATGFCAGLVASLMDVRPGPVLWCQHGRLMREFGALYGPGLISFGLDPESFIFIRVRKDQEILWAMEEALSCGTHSSGGLSAVVGEVPGDSAVLDLTASRRLQLAAEAGGVTAFLLRGHGAQEPCAAATRWRIAAAASGAASLHEVPKRARWEAALIKCRGAQPASWSVEWDHEAHRFAVAASLADGPALPQLGKRTETDARLRRTG